MDVYDIEPKKYNFYLYTRKNKLYFELYVSVIELHK